MKKAIKSVVIAAIILSLSTDIHNISATELNNESNIMSKSSSTTVVSIPDENLRKYIADALGKSITDDITVADMESLTELTYPNVSERPGVITSLEGLQYATNLEELRLDLVGGTNDLSQLSSLTNLKNLNIANTDGPFDLTILTGLTNLEVLYIQQCEIEDISPLASMTNLKTLSLDHNNISDISPISGLTQLTSLSLDEAKINDMNVLSGLEELKTLSLSQCEISNSDLEKLATYPFFENLTDLYLGTNKISDISILKNAPRLEVLNLYNNQISDISVVKDLSNLWQINLDFNQINDISPLSDAPISHTAYWPVIRVENQEIHYDAGILNNLDNIKYSVVDFSGNTVPIELDKVTSDPGNHTSNGSWDISQSTYDNPITTDFSYSGTVEYNYEFATATNEKPKIEGIKDQSINVNGTIDLLAGVTATDKEDGDLTSSIVVDDSKLDLTKVGDYEVSYSVTDSDGNTTTEKIIVSVVASSNEIPVISGMKNQTINVNGTIDLLAGVTATDKEDGDLTSSIVVDDSKLDVSKAGDYEVSYSVTDSDGNTTTEKIIVSVVASSNEIPVISGMKNQTINVNGTIDLLAGVTATDKEDGDLTSSIVVDDSKLDVSKAGDYEVSYSVTDSDGNTTTEKIIVSVELQDKPEVVDPDKPEVVDPDKPEVVDPDKPEVVDPDKPEVVDPSNPEVVDPSNPEVVDPSNPEVIDPDKPEVVDPDKPEVIISENTNETNKLEDTSKSTPLILLITSIVGLSTLIVIRKNR